MNKTENKARESNINITLLYLCYEIIAYVQILYTLNLLEITSTFHIVAIFITVDLQTWTISVPNFTSLVPMIYYLLPSGLTIIS
jgi:hypothetical protein